MKFQKYDCLSYVAYTNTSCNHKFLQLEAEKLVLFRIYLHPSYLQLPSLNVQPRVHGGCRLQSNKKYRYEIEILKCSSNVRHIWRKILTPCTQCSCRWSQFRIQFLFLRAMLLGAHDAEHLDDNALDTGSVCEVLLWKEEVCVMFCCGQRKCAWCSAAGLSHLRCLRYTMIHLKLQQKYSF